MVVVNWAFTTASGYPILNVKELLAAVVCNGGLRHGHGIHRTLYEGVAHGVARVPDLPRLAGFVCSRAVAGLVFQSLYSRVSSLDGHATFVCPSADRHLDCFCLSALTSNAAVDVGI